MRELKISVANLQSGDMKSFHFYVPHKSWQLNEEQVEVLEPLDIDGTITHAGDFYVLKVQVKTRLKMQCTRCLTDFEENYVCDIEEELRKAEGEDVFAEFVFDEDLYSTFSGQEIDLEEIVKEHMVLSLPIKRLCREDCLGICSICGQDRNKKRCDCVEDKVDPRLQALEQLLKQEN